MRNNTLAIGTLTLAMANAVPALADHLEDNYGGGQLAPVMASIDMMDKELVLINTESDVMIQQPFATAVGWPGGNPQHALIMPNGRTVFISTDATATEPARVVKLKVSPNWRQKTATLEVQNVAELEPAGTVGAYNVPTQIVSEQPIASWTQQPFSQIHGPSILPFSNFIYFTEWTGDKVRIMDKRSGRLVDGLDPFVISGITDHTHGITFNRAGSIGLGTGYYYDDSNIDVYSVDKSTGKLTYKRSIKLQEGSDYAAFTHHITWVDQRYAITGSMQFGKTSLTPSSANVVPPSLWLVDTWEGTAKKLLGNASGVEASGVFRSASDIAVAAGKLYIAEEDSIDGTYGDDGYISVYDISDVNHPVFLKRLKPGVELPADFAIAHTISATPNEHAVYVTSYKSGYILKIDTETDEVIHEYSHHMDGLMMPHAASMAGTQQ